MNFILFLNFSQLAISGYSFFKPIDRQSILEFFLIYHERKSVVDKLSVIDTYRYQAIIFGVSLTAPFNNMQTLKFKAQPTNAFFATVNQNVHRLLPAFDCCRSCGDQIVVQSSDNEQSSSVVVSWEVPPNT